MGLTSSVRPALSESLATVADGRCYRLIAIFLLIGAFPPSSAAAEPASATLFVGSTACASCHAKEYELWKSSHHREAMQVADKKTVLGDFSAARFRYGGITSTFSKRDGSYVVRTDGPDGKLHDYPVRYTFGIDPLQQYLIEMPGEGCRRCRSPGMFVVRRRNAR